MNPVLVGDDGVIVAGHGRIMAARKLGLDQAPVIVLAHLSPTQRRALMIADNQIASNSGWDDEMLAAELAALKEEDFDLDLLGFDDAALDRLLADTIEATEASDEAPEPPANPVSRPGDVWICGEHRVICGDATVLGDVETVLDGELADMTFCDPPYNVNYANSAKDKQRGKNRAILNDALGESFGAFPYDANTENFVAPVAPMEPLPLYPPLALPKPYPIEALGCTLGNVAQAIANKCQVPEAMAAQSVLAAASLIGQPHANVILPFGQTRPISLYITTVAGLGDRKSTADNEALRGIIEHEGVLRGK